eukprot:6193918-Pleurochrysis_carterae.AAC.2
MHVRAASRRSSGSRMPRSPDSSLCPQMWFISAQARNGCSVGVCLANVLVMLHSREEPVVKCQGACTDLRVNKQNSDLRCVGISTVHLRRSGPDITVLEAGLLGSLQQPSRTPFAFAHSVCSRHPHRRDATPSPLPLSQVGCAAATLRPPGVASYGREGEQLLRHLWEHAEPLLFAMRSARGGGERVRVQSTNR